MKTFVVLAVSIQLVSIFFCPMVMAFPPITADVQIVQPDPSLPKELSAFFGKWESEQWFVIVAKVDNKHATFYSYPKEGALVGVISDMRKAWYKDIATVNKVKGTYMLSYRSGITYFGRCVYYFRDNVLIGKNEQGQLPFTQVP